MQRGKAVRILINLFVIAAATISMIPFVLMFFMATQDNQMIFAGDIFRIGKALRNNFQTILDADYFRSLLNSLLVALSSTFLTVFSELWRVLDLQNMNLSIKKCCFSW